MVADVVEPELDAELFEREEPFERSQSRRFASRRLAAATAVP